MDATENDTVSVRDARAHLAEIIDRAIDGGATVITRGGTPVAAVISMNDYNALEDAVDEYFARQAEEVLQRDEPTYTMAEVLADVFGADDGKSPAA